MKSVLILFPMVLIPLVSMAAGETPVRVATYNINWQEKDSENEGKRLDHLREVIRQLDADIIGIQEVDNRRALEQIFDPQQWSLFIDDDSYDLQDLAIAVKRPLVISGQGSEGLDADDPDFLFEGRRFESAFPNRRDLLSANVHNPGESWKLRVYVHHAKSRKDGRTITEPRRIEASQLILKELKKIPAGTRFVLLGDFNDTPDDRSLNILETGDPKASAEMEEREGPFLLNLAEPLVSQDRVSQGRTYRNVRNGRVNTVDSGSREASFRSRGTNEKGRWDFLPDQILMPVQMGGLCPLRSARIFDGADAVGSDNQSRASDHLPVYVDLLLEK